MMPKRPATRLDFHIAIICALPLEVDAVQGLFDYDWDDDGPPYDKALGDPNAYSTGLFGRHNIVLAYMPGLGKANAAGIAVNCRNSFPNIRLALVVGVCGDVPIVPSTKTEIILGDVIMSHGIIQYDFERRLPERFIRKDTLLDSLGRSNTEVRALLAKLSGIHDKKKLTNKIVGYLEKLQQKPELKARYPGIAHDKLFNATYRHISDGETCEKCGCSGEPVRRHRLEQGTPQPDVHFGLIAFGDTLVKDGEQRESIAQREGVLAFEMEGAGAWDIFPCIVIKGACNYADSHRAKEWQRYAAATAAACTKAFLEYWAPLIVSGTSNITGQGQPCDDIRDLAYGEKSEYEHQSYIGAGAYADVEKVKKGALYFAQKTYKVHHGLEKSRESFQREVKLLKKLSTEQCRNVVRLHDAFTRNNKQEFFLILEPLAEKKNLNMRLNDYFNQSQLQTNDLSFLANAVLGLASGLAFIHRCQIRHKDICPDKILVYNGEVIYTDFGISLDWCNAKSSTTTSANPAYHVFHAAPELVNKPQLPRNDKSDVFSLGCLYFDIIAVATNSTKLLEHTIWGGTSGGYGFSVNTKSLCVIESYAGKLGCLSARMLTEDRDARPSAADVAEQVQEHIQPFLTAQTPQLLFQLG